MKILILFFCIAVGVEAGILQTENLIPQEEALEQFKQFIVSNIYLKFN